MTIEARLEIWQLTTALIGWEKFAPTENAGSSCFPWVNFEKWFHSYNHSYFKPDALSLEMDARKMFLSMFEAIQMPLYQKYCNHDPENTTNDWKFLSVSCYNHIKLMFLHNLSSFFCITCVIPWQVSCWIIRSIDLHHFGISTFLSTSIDLHHFGISTFLSTDNCLWWNYFVSMLVNFAVYLCNCIE
jgi:hypothetical protein